MGQRRVSIDLMADAILDGMHEYRELANDELKKAVRRAAATARKDINKSAPVRTGRYRKSWKTKVVRETSNTLSITVYSPDRYMLAHFLEFGHAKRGGGRVRAIPHIAPAEKHALQQLEEDLRRALE